VFWTSIFNDLRILTSSANLLRYKSYVPRQCKIACTIIDTTNSALDKLLQYPNTICCIFTKSSFIPGRRVARCRSKVYKINVLTSISGSSVSATWQLRILYSVLHFVSSPLSSRGLIYLAGYLHEVFISSVFCPFVK
jgi:hypothetical protein